MTVEELAAKMQLTANAVRNQLAKLVEANLVERAGSRPGPSKPSVVYAITLDGQVQFSTIYLPVLTQFLRTAEEGCTNTELSTFMTYTGKALGKRYPNPSGPLKTRVSSAAQLLRLLGGIPKVRSRNGSLVLESISCPLSALTKGTPAACRILEGLLREYRSADLFLLPLTDCTANNCLLEAMACGLPLVASDVGGVRDYATDESAALVPPGDGEAMADAVLGLCGDDERRAEMARAARRRALALDWDRVANSLLGVYEAVGRA